MKSVRPEHVLVGGRACVFVMALCLCTAHKNALALNTGDTEGSSIKIVASEPAAGAVSVSLSNEVSAAIRRSLDWLAGEQREDGSWSRRQHPALTAMPAMAFMRSEYTDKQKIVSRALEFIAARAQEDGGIYVPPSGGYGGGLEVYNTAVSMTALYASGNQSYLPVIRKARDFIAASQHYGDDIYKGGFGYREEGMEEYVHGLNTFYSMQAMALTESIDTETTNEDGRARIDWGGTVDYFQLRQDNAVSILPEAPQLAYSPGPAEKSLEEDRFFHSYGSMTYVGLLALVYADIDRSDVRVRSAFDWAREHWTLEENPGRGEEGVFFFYYVLTRALSAYGVDLIQTSRGEFLNWRAEVAERVISLQRYDPDGRGYWVNDTARFWEDDPVLCTSYANLTLQMLLSPGMPR